MKNSPKTSDFITVDRPMNINKFKVGELVWVAYNVESQKGWRAGWNSDMAKARGKQFEVIATNQRDGYRLKTNKVDGMDQDYWFPDGALVQGGVFAEGDKVRIACNPVGWVGWVAQMAGLVGSRAVVILVRRESLALDNGLSYPPYALSSLDPKEDLSMSDRKATQETELGAHDPRKFPVGSKVRIFREVLKQEGWNNSWNIGPGGMSELVGDGKVYEIIESGDASGYRLKDAAFRWPSGALQWADLSKQAAEVGAKVTLVIEKGGKKKRRVRVGPGPWDAAPCTHLRWHLMGFFREKLAFKKTKTMVKAPLPDGTVVDVEADIASVQVVCTKCGTSMTLNAK